MKKKQKQNQNILTCFNNDKIITMLSFVLKQNESGFDEKNEGIRSRRTFQRF